MLEDRWAIAFEMLRISNPMALGQQSLKLPLALYERLRPSLEGRSDRCSSCDHLSAGVGNLEPRHFQLARAAADLVDARACKPGDDQFGNQHGSEAMREHDRLGHPIRAVSEQRERATVVAGKAGFCGHRGHL